MQLKFNFLCWLHLYYKDEPLPEMEQHAKAIAAHHFNLHTWCGTWCKQSLDYNKVPIQYPSDKKNYRCGRKNKEMFDLCNKHLSLTFKRTS